MSVKLQKFLSTILLFCIAAGANAQHIFPKKLNNCQTSAFCLDCGDIKVQADSLKFSKMIHYLNSHNNVNNLRGSILFQVLVDSTGKGCVLSYTDVNGRMLSEKVVMALNDFTGWSPASTNGKIEGRVSVNVAIDVLNGKLSGRIQRVTEEFATALFDRPVDPDIENKHHKYDNAHLGSYKMTVWNSKNSIMKDNLSDHLTVDRTGVIFYETNKDLYRLENDKLSKVDRGVLPPAKYYYVRGMATDNSNVKWFYTESGVYSYNDKDWVLYDSLKTGIKRGYSIINNVASGEVFFTSDQGLIINNNGSWSVINKANLKALPSDRVYYAKKDKKGRIWIGTFSGSVMIDADGTATDFNAGSTVLKGKCITSLEEDSQGNLYFGLYEYAPADRKSLIRNEGIAVFKPDGSWKQLTIDNSGIPVNNVGPMLYDEKEDVLWIGTERAGLVRYDLKDGWEFYNNKNSEVPSSFVTDISKDAKGNIYLATRYGLVKMEKK
ncbi:ligand-binding sensor domain-containing protein [Pedobacter ginsengisoli]|uniref:ligand-binding sensor domain-containing protein n=1 Tax=Pedobacter ginsengisoli TaxID=363852 RepID=UPI00254A0AA1|nr:two-component regulator propeller domain-containing protein [Pedobacter ginsengisoli]